MCEETVPFYLLLAGHHGGRLASTASPAPPWCCWAPACGVLGSTVNPFAVGVAVDALSGIGVSVNQGIIIALGLIIWITSLVISIIFVMRYAKKVKADKGSTFLSLQEQQDMMDTWGMTESTEEAATNDTAQEPGMTGRQKWTLVVFALTFVIMIVGFIPWNDLNVDVFNFDATSEEITTAVNSEDIVATYDEATETSLAIPEGVEGEVTEEVTTNAGWSSFLTGVPLGGWYFDEASTWFFHDGARSSA